MLGTGIVSNVTAIAVLVLGIILFFWLMYSKKRRKNIDHTNIRPSRLVVARDNHSVSRKYISDNALKVVNRLNSQGFDAYLVGGCIRDIYVDLHPKDFDVATNATPEEVRSLFRNSRLIGRRFKLVHVLFGREMIEVATFRASHNEQHSKDKSHHSDSGRILRDNVYGSMEDDAIRRDFTVNALYYDARDFSIVDFCGGIDDIRNKTLRLIGDPVTRYHEDPVRMLRAIRFAAKLDFKIAKDTEQPIRDLADLLRDIPSARLFDEVLKLLQSGQGVKTFQLLREYQLFETLFPAVHHCLQDGDEFAEKLILSALKSTDHRIARGKPVTPAFLFAAMLWSPMQRLARDFRDQGVPPVPAIQQAATTVLENQVTHTAIPKRFSIMIREIWDSQHRLIRRQPKVIQSLREHPRFRASYDFLILREEAGEDLGNAGQWWTDYQEVNEETGFAMIRALRNTHSHGKSGGKRPANNKRRRQRRGPVKQNTNGGAEG